MERIKKLYNDVEKKVKEISEEAYKAFKERDDAIQNFDNISSLFGSIGGFSSWDLKQGAINELQKDINSYSSKLRMQVNLLTAEIERQHKSLENVEGIFYLLDGLDKLAVYTQKLDYTVRGFGTYTGCHSVVTDASKKWRAAIESDKTIHKRQLQNQLEKNKKDLESRKKELHNSQIELQKLRDKLVELMQNYKEGMKCAIDEAGKEFAVILNEIKNQEIILNEENSKQIAAVYECSQASAFSKKNAQSHMQEVMEQAKQKEKTLQEKENLLKQFVTNVFAAKIEKYDVEIENVRNQIFSLNDSIALLKSVIEQHKINIERINGELNV